MTLHLNTAETGLASGTAATTANTGSGGAGDALTITLAGGGAVTFSSTWKHRNSLSYAFNAATTGDVARAEWGLTGTQTATEIYTYMTAYPSLEMPLIQHRFATGSNAYLQITAAGNARLYDTANTALWLSSSVLPLNTVCRHLLITKVNTASVSPFNGILDYSYFSGAAAEGTTPTEQASTTSTWFGGTSSSAANTGTANLSSTRIGKPGSGGTWSGLYIDDVQWNDSSTAAPGPVPILSGSVSPTSGTASTTVITATISGAPTTTYTVTWGDGATSSSTTNSSGAGTASHTYTTAGTYTVTAA